MLKLSTPTSSRRPAQPYAAIERDVPMQRIGTELPPLIDEVANWLKSRGIAPRGPAFFRYRIVDMEGLMKIDVGLLLNEPVQGDDTVYCGELPEGRYISMLHTGHPHELREATRHLLEWADGQHITWSKQAHGATGEAWTSRVELYLNGPDDEPDMNRWQTELAFMAHD